MTPALRHGVGENKESKVATHFHVDYSGIPGYFLVRAMDPGDTGRECDCEAGEIELYHDAIDDGDVDEECPCPACQHYREEQFKAWREQQAAAGIVAEHTVTGEAGPDV